MSCLYVKLFNWEVFNEENTVAAVIDKIASVSLIGSLQKEIVIVNDCSTDNTDQVITDYMTSQPDINISYYRHERNTGKGGAIHTGLKHFSGDLVIIQA